MITCRETVLADIVVISFGLIIGRVTIEKAHRPVVLTDELFKILVLNVHFGKPAVGLLGQREVIMYIMWLAGVAGQTAGIAEPDELIAYCMDSISPSCLSFTLQYRLASWLLESLP